MTSGQLNMKALEAATIAVISDELDYIETMSGAEHVARLATSAYLAVAHPAITTVEELDTLPVGSIVEDSEPCVLRLSPEDGKWYVPGGTQRWGSRALSLPARVLHLPEVAS